MLLTIIIPVYNSAEEIHKLLENLTRQNLSETEIILVDDESKDNSLEICRNFETENITVYTQKNSGCYVARQVALEKAKGSFVTFLDSDDSIGHNYVQDILKVIKDNDYIDIFVFGYNQVYPKEKFVFNNKNKSYDCGEYFADLMRNKIQGPFALWNHVYSRTFLKNNNINFNTKYRKAGDAVFNSRCLMANPRVHTSEVNVYTWRCGYESLTSRFEPSMWEAIYEHEKNLDELCARYFNKENSNVYLCKYRWYYFVYLFNNIFESKLTRKEKKTYLRIILKNNLDNLDIQNNLKNIRFRLVRAAKEYSAPIYLYFWKYSYISTWLVMISKIVNQIRRKNA